jgi:hypothetical protein
MEKPLAARFIETSVALDAPINKLLDLVAEIADPEEKAAFNRAVGDLMGLVFARLMVPVLRQYPDLDPDK